MAVRGDRVTVVVAGVLPPRPASHAPSATPASTAATSPTFLMMRTMAIYPQSAGPDRLYDRGVALELGHTTDRKPPFKYAAYTRVGFSDTDAQGIVYYGRYLPYFDFARVEYHRHLGLLVTDRGEHDFVMRAARVLYEAPARFDDLLEVF